MSAPAVTSPLEPGAALETVCELGRGGMGSVRLVRLAGPGEFTRLFVQKRLRPDRADEEMAQRFVSEGRIAGAIRHVNVVQTHHVGHDQQGMFLLLDYVEGASLEQLMTALAARGRRVPLPIALRITLDALGGLSAVHEARDLQGRSLGVLHRDVTLQNLLLGVDGVTRIADFGIAKSTLSAVVTEQQYLLGKLRYLAPEYVRRETVSCAMDVYALGISFWHLLTARTLWREASEAELVEHILNDEVPDVMEFVRVPEALNSIVRRACAKQAEQRFESARDMAQAIESAGLPIASHAEVAELVRAACADLLSERRRLLADATSRSNAEPRAPAPPAPPAGRTAEPQQRSRQRAWWLFVGALTLFAAGALALALLGTRGRQASAALSAGVPASSALTPASPTVLTPSRDAVRIERAPPTAMTPSRSTAAASTGAKARPPSTARKPPSSAIVVRNPYRN